MVDPSPTRPPMVLVGTSSLAARRPEEYRSEDPDITSVAEEGDRCLARRPDRTRTPRLSAWVKGRSVPDGRGRVAAARQARGALILLGPQGDEPSCETFRGTRTTGSERPASKRVCP